MGQQLLRSTVLGLALLAAVPVRAGGLPEPVQRTLAERFPGYEVLDSGRESEREVSYFEVHLVRGDRTMEVEIAADGNVGETEAAIELSDLPPDQQQLIRDAIDSGTLLRIEKHVRFGAARNGTFEPVAKPGGFYEVTYRDRGYNRYVSVPVRPEDRWALEEEDD